MSRLSQESQQLQRWEYVNLQFKKSLVWSMENIGLELVSPQGEKNQEQYIGKITGEIEFRFQNWEDVDYLLFHSWKDVYTYLMERESFAWLPPRMLIGPTKKLWTMYNELFFLTELDKVSDWMADNCQAKHVRKEISADEFDIEDIVN